MPVHASPLNCLDVSLPSECKLGPRFGYNLEIDQSIGSSCLRSGSWSLSADSGISGAPRFTAAALPQLYLQPRIFARQIFSISAVARSRHPPTLSTVPCNDVPDCGGSPSSGRPFVDLGQRQRSFGAHAMFS